MPRRLFTVGYEGRAGVADLVAALGAAGVRRVVDVRALPLSRKRGFSKSPLKAGLEAGGFEYVHLRALGVPADVRHAYKEGGGFEAFRAAYARVLEENGDALDELKRLARDAPTALLCAERDASKCHRALVAEALARDGFDVTHLA